MIKKRIAVVLWTLCLALFLASCDNTIVPTNEDINGNGSDETVKTPEIPAELIVMEGLTYNGSSPSDLADLMEAVINGIELAGSAISQLSMTSTNREVEEFYHFYKYINNTGGKPYTPLHSGSGYQMSPDNFTGTVNFTFNEKGDYAELKGSYITELYHENILEVVQLGNSLIPRFLGVKDNSDFNGVFENGSFRLKMGADNLDLTVKGLPESNGLSLEFFNLSGNVSFQLSGQNLFLGPRVDIDDNGTTDELIFTGGTLNHFVDISLRLGMVLSSSNPAVSGCKVVLSLELKDHLEKLDMNNLSLDGSGFDVKGINLMDREQLLLAIGTFIDGISRPCLKIDVFAQDNSHLFSQTVPMMNEIKRFVIK